MGSNAAYTPLITVVSYALDELGKSNADADKLWLLGIRADAELRSDFAGLPKTVRLPVLPNKTVPLPPDCKTWSKIGLIDEKGQINTLTINNSLSTFRDTNPNRIQDLAADINDSSVNFPINGYYSNYYYNGGNYQLFGVQNGIITYGECRVDELNRIIILGLDFAYGDVVLEYISSPEKDTEYMVMSVLQEAIIAFMKWKLKAGAREEWIAAAISARRRMPNKKVILQTINQVIRESNGMKLRS